MTTERRLFVPALPGVGETVELDAEAARHLKVLRLAPPAEVVLFDGQGGLATARLVPGRGRAPAARVEQRTEASEPPVRRVLLSGLPRAGTFDDLVRAAVELGVTEIRPCLTEHAVPRAADPTRAQRLAAVVREAARQSERLRFPTVTDARPLRAHAEALDPDLPRFTACGRTGAAAPTQLASPDFALVVGPEGGLSAAELDALDALGFRRMRVGRTVLRVETATVAALSVLTALADAAAPARGR